MKIEWQIYYESFTIGAFWVVEIRRRNGKWMEYHRSPTLEAAYNVIGQPKDGESYSITVIGKEVKDAS